MEFSFFLILLTVVFYFLFLAAGSLVLFLLGKKRLMLLFVFFPAVLYFVNRPAAVISVVFILTAVFLSAGNRKHRYSVSVAVVAGILAGFCFYYLPDMNESWMLLLTRLDYFFSSVEIVRKSRISEIYLVAQFFRGIYPATMAVWLMLLILYVTGRKWKSFWYRFIRGFSHKQVGFVLALWPVYYFMSGYGKAWIRPEYSLMALNFAVFFTLIYAAYGFLTIVYGLRKAGIRYVFSTVIVYLLVVLSGPVFLIPLTFIVGIGISDIWMHYYKRIGKKIISK